MGLWERVKSFFSSLFDDRITGSTNGNITVWMPKFVKAVERNTNSLLKIARRLLRAAAKIRERNRKKKEKEEKDAKNPPKDPPSRSVYIDRGYL